jgi:hypothetical protein
LRKTGGFGVLSSEDEIEFIKDLVKSYRTRIPKLKLLVFGPGEKNPDEYAIKCYNKRLAIRQVLRNNHTVIFPEEALNVAQREGVEGKPIILFEKHLVEQSDCAIFISCPNCPGIEHEISVFATFPECVRKILFFYAKDREYGSNWVLEDWLKLLKGGGGKVDPFSEEDLDECHVMKKIEDEIQNIATFCSIYPYKKYGGVDNGN